MTIMRYAGTGLKQDGRERAHAGVSTVSNDWNARGDMVEREATLDEAFAWFRDDVAAWFAFLGDEYGFRPTSTRDEGRDRIFIRFRSETTAIEVAYEPADDAVEVFLIKVERGRVASYAQAWQRNWVPLFRYLDHVGARGAEGPKSVVWGDREGLRRVLAQHAEALRNHGNDVLSGDFSVFDAAKAPALSEEQLYEVDESSDPWVGEEELREARSFRVRLAAWVARRLRRGEHASQPDHGRGSKH